VRWIHIFWIGLFVLWQCWFYWRSPRVLCRSFLTTILLRHATAARWNTFLQAATNISPEIRNPLGSVSLASRVALQLDYGLCAASSFTAAFSVGTSQCSSSDSMSPRFCSLLSRHTSVLSWQATVSFRPFFYVRYPGIHSGDESALKDAITPHSQFLPFRFSD
jgi:hypothetical protein